MDSIKSINEKLIRPIDKVTIDRIKKTSAKVTVIVPTYNRADLIRLTMNSIEKQSYKEYICIILDDGSTDNTSEIVSNFIKDKKNWFYLYHDNVGEAETVNKGWRLCNSEYFVQVNSDDTIEPTLFSEMVRALDDNPEYVVAYPDFYIINENGDNIEETKNQDWNFIEDLSLFSCYAAAPGAFIRKSLFKDWDEIKDGKFKYINDVKMLWNMALSGNFIHVPKFLASWRLHTDGISNDRYKSIDEINVWVDEYFSQKGLPKRVRGVEAKCRQSIDNYCAKLIDNSNIEAVISNYIKVLNNKYQALINKSLILMDENKRLKTVNDLLVFHRQELEQSSSWRITRPLRGIVSVLRELKNRK